MEDKQIKEIRVLMRAWVAPGWASVKQRNHDTSGGVLLHSLGEFYSALGRVEA